MLPSPGVGHPLGTVSADMGECEREDEVHADKSGGFTGGRSSAERKLGGASGAKKKKGR